LVVGKMVDVVHKRAKLTAEREIKARQHRKRCEFERRRNLKCRLDMSGAIKFGPKFPSQSPENTKGKHSYEKQHLSHFRSSVNDERRFNDERNIPRMRLSSRAQARDLAENENDHAPKSA